VTFFVIPWRTLRNTPVLRALVFAQLYQLFGAWLLTLPLTSGVAASGVTGFPEGAAKLFEPGGLYLLEVLQHEQSHLFAALSPGLVLLTLWSVGSIVPEWCVLASLAGLPLLPERVRRSYLRVANLGVWCVLTWLVRALCWVLTFALAFSLRSRTLSSPDERLPDLLFLGVLAAGALLQIAISGLHDLTATRLVSTTTPIGAGVGHALAVLRNSWLHLVTRYAALRLAMLMLLIVTESVVGLLRHPNGSDWRLGTCAAVHQLALFGTLLLHAIWLACALAAVE
jgi:hypothetical protein